MSETSTAPRLVTTHLKVGGMSCSFCVESIRKAVARQKGVEEVHVSLAHEEALVRFRPEEIDQASIENTLRALGYTIRDPREVQSFEEQEQLMARQKRDLLAAAAFAFAAFLAMTGMWLDVWTMRVWHAWAAWAAASFVFFWTGRHIIHMAWGAARRGITNQHVLLTAGASGGYIGGLLGMPIPALGWWGLRGFPAVDFFGVVIFLTTYHLLSGYVSLFVRTRASQSVRKLLELQPPTARVVRSGREQTVGIDEVRVGDIVRIRPGEKVPIDGEVVEGRSAVDEALVTGEPIPSDKEPGAGVIGGSFNQAGTLLVRVTRTGADSFLHQVARHVEEARALKPAIIVLVDQILKYYVPVVLLISLGALLFWTLGWALFGSGAWWIRAVYAAVSVLVMGYPCALGMATPLALIRGAGTAAEHGILIRSGEAFQTLKDIEIIALDKTGTITKGEPRVLEIVAFGGYHRLEVYRYAASAEGPSEHPLGRAIVECAEAEQVRIGPARDFNATPGGGVQATVDGKRLRVGRMALLEDAGVDVSAAYDRIRREEAQGNTVVLVAVDGELAGLIAIADALKPDARETVRRMRALGLTPVMLTGDAELTARTVAREVGIDVVHARVLPDEKAARVRELQRGGRRVAFVGDGINDAPALMQADVGIAIGAGTDIAIESSDVILIGERLSAVLDACVIGGRSYRKTVQNLWLAFSFNGVGIPLAATGFVHPVWAMIAMAASVSAVLLNSFGGSMQAKRPTRSLAAAAELATKREMAAAAAANEVETIEKAPARSPAHAILEVPDIHCIGCEQNIEALLGGRDGVAQVHADAESKRVRVAFWPDRIGLPGIEETVTSLGFRVRRAHVPGEDETGEPS